MERITAHRGNKKSKKKIEYRKLTAKVGLVSFWKAHKVIPNHKFNQRTQNRNKKSKYFHNAAFVFRL